MMKNKKIISILTVAVVIAAALFLIFSSRCFFRLDLTQEKRYTVSQTSRNILAIPESEIGITLYLAGELDANMTHLRYAVKNKVEDLSVYSSHRINFREEDPNGVDSDEDRYANYKRLEDMGLKGMSVSMRNDQGGISQSIIFPWLIVTYNNDTMPVCLIDPDLNLAPQSASNATIEDLEYMLVDAIRIVSNNRVAKIAFIEGHGELNEMHTYDISEVLSRYFQVDRGVIGGQLGVLDGYDAVIIANPSEVWPEEDKFVVDQYIMNGGSVLWSIDGVRKSDTLLSDAGLSPVLALDVNLGDMLFKYGVRVSSTIVQDMQCQLRPINIARPNETAKFENIPWYYAPLLKPSPYHHITKNKGEIAADFASALEFTGDTTCIKKEILLISSNASHVTMAPSEVDINKLMNNSPEDYFIHAYVPIAATLHGEFTSLFKNRILPPGVYPQTASIRPQGKASMIVIADGSIMENAIEPHNGGVWLVPLGYDRLTKRTYGNKDFIVNAMLHLTDNSGLMQLRNRIVPARLLNSAIVKEHGDTNKYFNIIMPLVFLALLAMILLSSRKRKYGKHNR